ncbi:MAG: hypothetical protein M3335_05730 [Actinomycetota bacterium]|nr:hypothetical protein [Actinomycetota bacterium]
MVRKSDIKQFRQACAELRMSAQEPHEASIAPHAYKQVQEWMGHRDIKTTMIYADYAPSEHESAMVDAAFSQI